MIEAVESIQEGMDLEGWIQGQTKLQKWRTVQAAEAAEGGGREDLSDGGLPSQ